MVCLPKYATPILGFTLTVLCFFPSTNGAGFGGLYAAEIHRYRKTQLLTPTKNVVWRLNVFCGHCLPLCDLK